MCWSFPFIIFCLMNGQITFWLLSSISMKPMVLLLGFVVFVDNFNFAQIFLLKFGDLCMFFLSCEICLHIFQLLFNWSLLNIVLCMNSKVGVSFSSTFQATFVNLHKLVQHLGTKEFYNKAKSGIIELFVIAWWKVYGCKWTSLGDFSTCCSTFFLFSFFFLKIR